MKWFRSNIKSHSRIALFALVIQFALSFGHFHGVAADSTSAAQPAAITSQSFPVRAVPLLIGLSRPAGSPVSDDRSGEHPGDHCAICAVMAMAQAMLFATPLVLSPPQAIELSYLSIDGQSIRAVSVEIAFQPRAPPIC